MELKETNRDYLRNKINYILVKNSTIKPREKKDEIGLFTWNDNEKLRYNDNKKLTVGLAAIPTVVTAVGVLTGIAGMVFIGGAAFTGNQTHAEMGAQTLQAAGNMLDFGLKSAVIPMSIFGFSVFNSWYKKIYNSRVEKREDAIRIQKLISMMTGTRSRERANKDTDSYKIAISLYQEVNLSKMRKNMLLELFSSLAAFKEKEDLLGEGQVKEADVTIARNNFFQTYYRLLDTKDCPRDLVTNGTICSIIRKYGEQEQKVISKQEEYAAHQKDQRIIDFAKAKKLLELKENSDLSPSMIAQMYSNGTHHSEEEAVGGITRRR